jgi:hypothetical protein
MAWSGPDVLGRTEDMLRRSRLSVHMLPIWQDADTINDLHDLLVRNRNTPFASSRTMRFLEALSLGASVTEEPHAQI